MDDFEDLFSGDDDLFGDDAPDWLSDFSLEGDDTDDDFQIEEIVPPAAPPQPAPDPVPTLEPPPPPPIEQAEPELELTPAAFDEQPVAPTPAPEPMKPTPAAPKQSEARTVSLPEWLQGISQAAEPSSGPTAPPDWLGAIASNASIPDRVGATPDWLARISEVVQPPPATPIPEPEPVQEEPKETQEIGWVDDIFEELDTRLSQSGLLERPPGLARPESAPIQEMPSSIETESSEDMPDWLRQATDFAADEPETPDEESVPEANQPDWLKQFDKQVPSTSSGDASPSATVDTETAPLPESEVDIPNWLKETDDVLEENSEDVLGLNVPTAPLGETSAESSDIPDWMRQAGDEAPGMNVQTAEFSDADMEVPDWLQDNDEPPTDSDGTGPLFEETLDDTPDWLKQVNVVPSPLPPVEPSSTGPESKTGPLSKAADVPEWLKPLDAPTTEQPNTVSDPGLLIDTGPLPDVRIDETIEAALEDVPSTNELDPRKVDGEEDIKLAESPDWLANVQAVATGPLDDEDEQSEEIPSWLQQIKPTEDRQQDIPEDDDDGDGIPDWLAGAADLQPQAPSEPVAAEEDDEAEAIPDWISKATSDLPPSRVEEDEPDGDEGEEIPAWLAAAQTADLKEAQSVEEAEEDDEAEAIPDWISKTTSDLAPPRAEEDEPDADAEEEIPAWLAAAQTADLKEAQSVEEAEEDDEAEAIPDWISNATSELKTASSDDATPVEDTPDWLAQVVGTPKSNQPSTSQAPKQEDEPDWLRSVGLGGTPKPAAESAQGTEVPDWLRQAQASTAEPESAAKAETQAPDRPETQDTPDWLVQIKGDAAEREPTSQDDVPDWLQQAQATLDAPPEPQPFEVEPDQVVTPEPQEDWIDSLGIDAGPREEQGLRDAAKAIGFDTDQSERSAKELREMSRSSTKWDIEDTAIRKMKIDLNLAGQIQDLRFEEIVDDTEAAQVETVGPLRDVKGAVRAELIFEGANLRVRDPIEQLVVTESQQQRVEILRKLMEGDDRLASEPITQRRGVAIIERYIVTLLLIVTVALPTLAGAVFLPAQVPVTTDVTETRSVLAAAPEDATVLLAVEYEANAQAEMEPMVSAVLADLATRPDATVYVLSTQEMGPALAEQALAASSKQAEKTWRNLGYVSGEANAIRTLSTGGLGGAFFPFDSDVYGRDLQQPAQTLNALDIDILIIAASKPELLRIWLEQTSLEQDSQTVALVSQSVAPIAYPYQQSGQLDAMLVGFNDGISYSTQVETRTEQLVPVWNGLGFGSTVAAFVIILGAVVYGLRALASEDEE